MRDNALATALKRAGHDVTLVPLYTPLRTDAEDASIGKVFYGGVNAYLQYASRFFRRTPRLIDWLLDRRWLLNLAGRFGAQTSPAKLGAFTLSILEGEDGPQIKELRRLASFIKSEIRPQVVSLPNLMFIGTARLLCHELGAPVICELTGEDIFLDALTEPFRTQARCMIRQRAADVSRFVATSDYYANRMADYLAIPRDSIDVVYPGVSESELSEPSAAKREDGSSVVGYLARICPEKGLDRLLDAFIHLRKLPGMDHAELRVAGYLGSANRSWYAALQHRIDAAGLGLSYEFLGQVDLPTKRAFLDSIDVLCVPTAYPEPKGIYVLESLSRGTPVVLPNHGSFPELIQLTGGGLLAPPGDAAATAQKLSELLTDRPKRLAMGAAGRQAIRDRFTDERMAAKMLYVYQRAQS
jgi:glycosyltransferase involved in cell wall biosynthesis